MAKKTAMADQHLDCKQMNCPMPLVAISRAMKGLSCGQVLSVEATDPAFKTDVEAWIKQMGHKLVEFREDGSVQTAVIQKSDKG
ncbi:MAG: sulfurtransferase TusA family protein [Chloroflexota bacterium]|nr:sulfurtransferase TusA family protein [Chloroflexota bacterium]